MEENQELKQITPKITKKFKIHIEIDEKMKKDLEFIQFYFYRDTSKKFTKKMIEDMIIEKLVEMKKKIVQDLEN